MRCGHLLADFSGPLTSAAVLANCNEPWCNAAEHYTRIAATLLADSWLLGWPCLRYASARLLIVIPPTASYPSPMFTRGMSMDNAIVSGTLFTLMVLGGVLAGIALMMM